MGIPALNGYGGQHPPSIYPRIEPGDDILAFDKFCVHCGTRYLKKSRSWVLDAGTDGPGTMTNPGSEPKGYRK